MKFVEKEMVDGTSVTIGRKVQFRTDHAGNRTQKVSRTYTAEYRDLDGTRRFEGLGATNKREARRRAIEIQKQLEDGQRIRRPSGRLGMATLIERYWAYCQSKGLTPKTLAKYKAELDKVRAFCIEARIEAAAGFGEEAFHQYGAWLREKQHKQGRAYASKSIYTSMTLLKQLFRFAKRQKLIAEDRLDSVALPYGKAKPQACFREDQVKAMLAACHQREGWRTTHDAIAILAYSGMRVGELRQLEWSCVLLDRGSTGAFRITKGGSADTPKDKDWRVVPIHPNIRPIVEAIPRTDILVLPEFRERTLLARIKRLCLELGYGTAYKTHSLRHHFVSLCASNGVPSRLVLSWVGHSSSDLLDLYYTLHDAESETAMVRLAGQNGHIRSR